MGLNGDDSHSSVSSKPLTKDEEANQTVTPKCNLFIPLFFDEKSILGCFEQSIYLDISILQSLAFSSKLIFTSKECLKVRFFLENYDNSPLEH